MFFKVPFQKQIHFSNDFFSAVFARQSYRETETGMHTWRDLPFTDSQPTTAELAQVGVRSADVV